MKNTWLAHAVKYAKKIDESPENSERILQWQYIASNPNVHLNDVLENPDLPWGWLGGGEWVGISSNPNIRWTDVEANLSLPWSYWILSQHPQLSLEFVKAHPTYNWNWVSISANKNITWEIVCANRLWDHPDKTKRRIPWSFKGLSMNPNITMEFIEANMNYSWSTHTLLNNPNITWDFIKRHLDKDWDWERISRHPMITWEIVVAHPEIKWSYCWLSGNPNITMEIISANRDKPWNGTGFSQNKNVTIEVVKQNRWFPWNSLSLAGNPNITAKDILENSGKGKEYIFNYNSINEYYDRIPTNDHEYTWHDIRTNVYSKYELNTIINSISYNPNITWDIVEAYPELRWNYRLLFDNKMSEPVKKRVQARNEIIKEDLVAAVNHPDRVERMAKLYSMDVMDYMDYFD